MVRGAWRGFALCAAVLLSGCVLGGALVTGPAAAASLKVRIAAQKTGTLAWELEVIRNRGLDREAGLDLEVVELASPEAAKIALRGGTADLIVSDWLWVARERALGDKLVFYPYSSQIGAVMVAAGAAIAAPADLRGHTLAVAGGQLDKSWLLLQADARRGGVDLRRDATVVYGAPPLLSQKALQHENDATLTFWNFCAELEARGLQRGVDMVAVERRLGAAGPVAMLGYVFDAGWAGRNRDAVGRFLAVTAQAKDILANSPEEWQRLAPRIGVTGDAALDLYRRRYAEGIPRRPLADEARDAAALYAVLAAAGGAELVGPAAQMDPGTFYDPEHGD